MSFFFWIVRVLVVATLFPAFFIMWGLAGADDVPRNVVAPFLGLAKFVSSAWAAVTAFGALPEDVTRALAIFALAPAIYLVAWPFSGTESTGREPPSRISTRRDLARPAAALGRSLRCRLGSCRSCRAS